ncbi:unnamed protein product, partial [Didymodactylos carnosus]
ETVPGRPHFTGNLFGSLWVVSSNAKIADRQLQTNVQVSLSAQNNELEDLMRLYYSKINEKTRGN